MIYLAEPEAFFPTWNHYSTKWLKELCPKVLKWAYRLGLRADMRYNLCHELNTTNYVNTPYGFSYTNHLWHDKLQVWSWSSPENGLDIKAIMPNIKEINFTSSSKIGVG